MQDQQQVIVETEYIYIVAIILAILWSKRRHLNFMKRMQRSRKASSISLDDEKIIVAIEIQNLLVQCSNRKLKDFIPLQVQTNQHNAIKKLKNLFGYGAYYRLMHERTKIKTFLKTLASFDNVQLYLYTSLDKQFTEKILQKLRLEDYFPEEHRRYSEEEDIRLSQKKHASWVDSNTRRVMIVTPNREDYDEEDKKYFLVLNKVKKHKLLKSALGLIRDIVQKVHSIDELHNEMDEVNAQMESEYDMDEDQTN